MVLFSVERFANLVIMERDDVEKAIKIIGWSYSFADNRKLI